MALELHDTTTGKLVSLAQEKPVELIEKPAEAVEEQQPPEPKPKKKAVDTEGTDVFAARFLEGNTGKPVEFKGDKDKKGKEKEKPKAEGVEDPEKKADAPPPKPKPKARPVAPALTAADVARAAAEGVATALKPAPKVEAKPEPDGLTEDHRATIEVLDEMAKGNKKYEGISERFKKSTLALVEYASKWEQENAGEKFDEEAPEHADFMAKHDVDWADGDYNRAVARLEYRKEMANDPERKQLSERLTNFEKSEKLRAAAPLIDVEAGEAAKSFWPMLGDEFKDLIGANGQPDAKKFQEMMDTDPLMEQRVGAAVQLETEVSELYKLQEGLIPFSKDNPLHQRLSAFLDQIEAEMVRKPADDQLDQEGRQFLPEMEYAKRLKADKTGTEGQFWTFSFKDRRIIRAARLAKTVKASVAKEEERLEKIARARGYTIPERNGNNHVEREEEPDPDDNGKPRSPSSAASPKSGARIPANGKVPEQGLARFYHGFV